jgi:hypothetical protein
VCPYLFAALPNVLFAGIIDDVEIKYLIPNTIKSICVKFLFNNSLAI